MTIINQLPPAAAETARAQGWNDESIAEHLLGLLNAHLPGDPAEMISSYFAGAAEAENGECEAYIVLTLSMNVVDLARDALTDYVPDDPSDEDLRDELLDELDAALQRSEDPRLAAAAGLPTTADPRLLEASYATLRQIAPVVSNATLRDLPEPLDGLLARLADRLAVPDEER